MIELVRRFSGRPFPTEESRLPEIVEAVRSERRMAPERNALLGTLLGDFFHTKAVVQFAGMDKSYCVGENCSGCGMCSRICPRGNLTIQDGKPVWHHDCDFCGACATWCPQGAIGLKGSPSVPRKHNPQVKAADLEWAK
jgi:ferredoxin